MKIKPDKGHISNPIQCMCLKCIKLRRDLWNSCLEYWGGELPEYRTNTIEYGKVIQAYKENNQELLKSYYAMIWTSVITSDNSIFLEDGYYEN